MDKMTYIMIWVEEREKWFYFLNKFDENQFPHGYVDYYVDTVDGIITRDTYNLSRVGKEFNKVYDVTIWPEVVLEHGTLSTVTVGLNSLLNLIQGGTTVVIGRENSEGDKYWPTVDGNKWLWQGNLIDYFKSEAKNTFENKEVDFVCIMPEELDITLKILIK